MLADERMEAKALWYVDCGRAELRPEAVAAPKQGELLVRAVYGAVSRGTERLIHSGRVPESEFERMRCPWMGGAFPFPVKYGYAAVGRVEAGAANCTTAWCLASTPTRRFSPCPRRPLSSSPTMFLRSAPCSPPI